MLPGPEAKKHARAGRRGKGERERRQKHRKELTGKDEGGRKGKDEKEKGRAQENLSIPTKRKGAVRMEEGREMGRKEWEWEGRGKGSEPYLRRELVSLGSMRIVLLMKCSARAGRSRAARVSPWFRRETRLSGETEIASLKHLAAARRSLLRSRGSLLVMAFIFSMKPREWEAIFMYFILSCISLTSVSSRGCWNSNMVVFPVVIFSHLHWKVNKSLQ